MTSPPPEQFTQLPKKFEHRRWTIRYADVAPDQASKTLQPVVFVHGTPWSSVVFVPLAKSLLPTGRYRIILYDLPGYGLSQDLANSESDDGDTSVKLQGEALAALLRHLSLDGIEGRAKPHVIAHDIAGVITLRAHLIHKCDYETLCLLDTNTVLPWGDKLYNLVRDNAHVFEQLPPGVFEGALRAVVQSACYDVKNLRSGWEDKLVEPWLRTTQSQARGKQNGQFSFVRQIKQSSDRHTAEMLEGNMYSKVRCDVKILWGENDQWIPREKIERLVQLLGSRVKEVVFVPEAGHLVMVDQPERVTFEVGTWLSR